MIKVEDISMSYRMGFMRRRKQVLNAISFEVREHSIVGYLGVNGAGKTTTIKLISGINEPDSGTIHLAGQPPQQRSARATLGYLPENPYFYEYLTPREALDLYGRLHALPRPERRKRGEALLERMQLQKDADNHVRGFSKGMRQRLGLAQALIHDPKVLILDEPLTGLDPMGRLLLRDIIHSERDAGRTVFFSSHILSDVEAICDDLVILDSGEIAYSGGMSALLDSFHESGVQLRFALDDPLPPGLEKLPWQGALTPHAAGYQGRLEHLAEGQQALDMIRSCGGTILEFRQVGISLEEYFLERFGQVAGKEQP